ncbi:hypothetical protein FEM48_Zijuj01G0005400 [Ziziphus jujuba var. spinosa]|uniref:SCP domain-containing protein n=1 Tax=Ziziphus jujuba var. spinosa TaxID=714518 RepID=A0A978VY40_ZIZJJ|nr:hypothetical protein FEM48_Zijuj01G0005400 [Ziziphus jujuba var. spinosa]
MHTTITTFFVFLVLISATDAFTKQNQYLNLANQFLAPQNAARSTLRMKPLVWDPRLARYAQGYANQRRNDCALKHSKGPYGENIFWGSGDEWTPAQAVTAWVSERKWYNYWSNSCAGNEQCGHYTQIVWRSTSRVGMIHDPHDDVVGQTLAVPFCPGFPAFLLIRDPLDIKGVGHLHTPLSSGGSLNAC